MNISSRFQYEYFFEDGAIPVVVEHVAQEPAMIAEEKSQTDLLLDNVQKIERKPLTDRMTDAHFQSSDIFSV